ncbi:mc family transporter [Cystoisospora suis]|uniref:Mc family transporter n=1 Tax=Cystoisospora suis TaxID=483139 RepID=A0A2C6LAG4_9APIC|nr:mc family transporter [Cystoisospora suis]
MAPSFGERAEAGSHKTSGGGGGLKDISKGAVLQCVEAGTLGMPFEVWKTRMGRYREESTIDAFRQIYRRGGVKAYWQGLSAKMVESATKGSVLLYSKELLFSLMKRSGFSDTSSGFVAGAGGGICQTAVMGPCTYVVTALVTNTSKNAGERGAGGGGALHKVQEVWKSKGIKGFYSGSTAIACRQATNWASRQGFTEFFRSTLMRNKKREGEAPAKLTKGEEILAGILGGTVSTWNQPFEVARIHMQAAANEGRAEKNLLQAFQKIVRQDGFSGLFKGLVPRIGLGVWQTLFMVTGSKLLREHLNWYGSPKDTFIPRKARSLYLPLLH